VEVETEKHTLLVGVRDFWQNYPKGLTAVPDRVDVELCPELGDTDYHVPPPLGSGEGLGVGATSGLEEDRLFFYLLEGGYKFRRGMARTHELLYHFGPPQSPVGRTIAALFQSPPPVRAPVDFYLASGVVGDLAPCHEARFGRYEKWAGEAGPLYEANTAARRAYGLLNYGDWHGERRYNWGNMEYDTPWGWLLEFLRGGDPACFERGARAAWHLVDVDTCHHDPNPQRLGGQYAHCMGHAGDYYPSGYREMATAVGGMSPSHTWVEGLFLYYALTGDRRVRECAEQTCRHLFGPRLHHYDFTNCRDSGWLLIHAMAAYHATSEEVYLNAARIIVQRVLERQRASGGWERLMVPGHCFCPPLRHYGEAGFMVGVLLSGLKRYHQATGEAAVAEAIVRGAEFLVRDMWVPEEACFHYTSCPHSAIAPGLNVQVLEGIAYAQRLSGSEALREVVTRGVRRCFEPFGPHVRDEGVGKEISMNLRSAPFILYEVGRLEEGLE
jgi:hypothetical protein